MSHWCRISMLDNASDSLDSPKKSSALLIALDHDTMTARVHRQWYRPDGELSYYRGNFQTLPNSNVFIGWGSQDNYMTEHSYDGQLLAEARFLSNRTSTYRAYKYLDFVGMPAQPPSLKVLEHEAEFPACVQMTVFYVSWNGATEVALWKFYSSTTGDNSKPTMVDATLVGQAKKTGFETTFAWASTAPFVFAEAVAANGTSLRNSTVIATKQTMTAFDRSCRPSNDVAWDKNNAAGQAAVAGHDIEDRFRGGPRMLTSTQALALLLLGLSFSWPLNRIIRTCHRRRGGII